MNYDYEYLRKNGVTTLEELVGQTLYFTFPSQGIKAMEVRKVQFTKKTREWFFDTDSSRKVSEIGKSIFFSEDEAVEYQHSIMEQFTKEQQEKIALREQKQREEDLKQLDRLIRKYADSIVIKVDHYISGNLDSGVIGHRRDYADYEEIEEIKSDIDGNIKIVICVSDQRMEINS